MDLGEKIREARKGAGLTIKQLAERVGVSYLTIQRMETNKVSPSVALLIEIAGTLNYPITSLIADQDDRIIHMRGADQPAIRSGMLELKVLAKRGVLNDHMAVSHGKAQPGEFVGEHENDGFELTYILKGRSIFKYGGRPYHLDEGDLIYFDARVKHSVIALEPHEFLAIFFKTEKKDVS